MHQGPKSIISVTLQFPTDVFAYPNGPHLITDTSTILR